MIDVPSRNHGWEADGVSRRRFIAGAATLAVAGAGTVVAVKKLGATTDRDQSLAPVCMAMHVHASASEGTGSMLAQLVQAERAGVDVLWWTEHDHRMSAHAAPALISFTGMTENHPAAAPWTWTAATQGSAASGTHTFCTDVSHPEIRPQKNAVLLSARSRGKHGALHQLTGQAENLLNRTSLAGLSLQIDVMPTDVSADAFLAIDVVSSFRPQDGSAPKGTYRLSYHVGGPALPGVSRLSSKTSAVITLAAPSEQWTTLNLSPQLDLVRLWPGVDGRDAALVDFRIGAGTFGGRTAAGYLAQLRFNRTENTGHEPLRVQSQLIAEYASRFPTVHQIQALEVSLTTPHLGWYGGVIELPTYHDVGPLPSLSEAFARDAVNNIHRHGGIASYCHPFGTSTATLSASAQEDARKEKASELIKNGALGCELLEVGYRLRGGCTLEQHESVWDNCSRNGILLTAVGVNDDHSGRDWVNELLNFVTWAWVPNRSQATLLSALRRGQVYFGDPARFRGALDLRIGRRSVMGSVTVSDADQRAITLLAAGVPSGASIQVLRGTVDYAGPAHTVPSIQRSSLSTSRLDSRGEVTIDVDTTESRFVRVVVVDQSGLPIGLSNPVWLLRQEPVHRSTAYNRRRVDV